jgi:hypothetical protein
MRRHLDDTEATRSGPQRHRRRAIEAGAAEIVRGRNKAAELLAGQKTDRPADRQPHSASSLGYFAEIMPSDYLRDHVSACLPCTFHKKEY